MKKIILSTFVLFFCASIVSAQVCPPDPTYTIDSIGLWPDSATGLNTTTVDQTTYETFFTAVVPADTVIVEGNPAIPIISMKLDSITGLPATFGIECNPPSCEFEGNSIGCAVLTGDPSAAGEGSYPLIVYITGTVELLPGLPIGMQDSSFIYTLEIGPAASAECGPSTTITGVNSNVTSYFGNVALSWDAVDGAVGYQLKGRVVGSSAFATITASNNFKNIGGLSLGVCYEWKVRAGCDLPVTIVTPFAPEPLDQFCTPGAKTGETTKVGIDVFPNPAVDFVNISYNTFNAANIEMAVYDILGKVVYKNSGDVSEGVNHFDIDVSNFTNGNYLVEISDGNNVSTERFSVSK